MSDEEICEALIDDMRNEPSHYLDDLLHNKTRVELVSLAWELAQKAVDVCPKGSTVDGFPSMALIMAPPDSTDGTMAHESYKDVQSMLRIKAKPSSYQQTAITSKLVMVPGYQMMLVVWTLGRVNVLLTGGSEENEE